ncbi:hypothetical protein G6F46_006923 [Rhizopus delemar]|uniref:Uncharacterized protein n=2 Tax=Rhizopus TaxID=4842 RepID=A0A9P6Z4L2_9FUNG|nr:hypothetical protein G6F43_009574 [Rhizopus delemar]KAG1552949.1 hypothetical protein G6F51_000892 [Rhizopus arrhizus]KAG1458099.1 hypothetical protein G6F55_005544 [Rhizopus delemar]KAG1497459.1 hypothetical protein G6F54_005751 [Rhizopus delemar]KAG1507611.1 hypothetical protein G6F53_008815 [Rhizopus delemar]
MSSSNYNPYSSLDDDMDNHYDQESLYSYDADAEWEESKQQLFSLLSLVIFPFAGKWLGKKFSFWVWAKYMNKVPLSSRYRGAITI